MLTMFLLKSYHDPSDEPEAPPLDPSFFDFDNGAAKSKEELKGTVPRHCLLTTRSL
jgi:hypothetical protein